MTAISTLRLWDDPDGVAVVRFVEGHVGRLGARDSMVFLEAVENLSDPGLHGLAVTLAAHLAGRVRDLTLG